MKRIQILALSLLLIGAAKHPQPGPYVISLAPSAWDVRYSSGVKLQALSGMAGWWFQFPGATGSVNYITTKFTTPLHEGQTVSASMQIVATASDPVFQADCGPATVRLYLEQAVPKGCPDATYSCKGVTPAYRWWSNPSAFALSPGQAMLSVSIDPDEWSDAEGRFGSDPVVGDGFALAFSHPAMIGMTFGGCGFGHGVNVLDGTARFILTNYVVQ